MARDPRYIPPRALVEVTDVTFQNRYLLRPSGDANELLLSCRSRRTCSWGVEVSRPEALAAAPDRAGSVAPGP